MARMYLYRAVDSQGKTLEFLLSPRRDVEAAKRFFVKALCAGYLGHPSEKFLFFSERMTQVASTTIKKLMVLNLMPIE
jgi:transposase, IS6 family